MGRVEEGGKGERVGVAERWDPDKRLDSAIPEIWRYSTPVTLQTEYQPTLNNPFNQQMMEHEKMTTFYTKNLLEF